MEETYFIDSNNPKLSQHLPQAFVGSINKQKPTNFQYVNSLQCLAPIVIVNILY